MLAVEQHLAPFRLGGRDAVADRGEVLLERRLERNAHLMVPRLGDEADGVRLGVEQRHEPRIVRGRAARPPRHAEGREGRRLELAFLAKELAVGEVLARIAALDILDAEHVEELCERELVTEREVNAVRLRAVAQRRVEEVETLLHRFTFQVVAPSLRSSSSIAMAASSSRMRSASLKSRALRAELRAAIRLSTCASSIASEVGGRAAQSDALCCSKPISCALALRPAAAPAEPFAASLRSS